MGAAAVGLDNAAKTAGINGACGQGSSKKRAQQDCARKVLSDETFWTTIESLASKREENEKSETEI